MVSGKKFESMRRQSGRAVCKTALFSVSDRLWAGSFNKNGLCGRVFQRQLYFDLQPARVEVSRGDVSSVEESDTLDNCQTQTKTMCC